MKAYILAGLALTVIAQALTVEPDDVSKDDGMGPTDVEVELSFTLKDCQDVRSVIPTTGMTTLEGQEYGYRNLREL